MRHRRAHARRQAHVLIISEPEDGVAEVGVQLSSPL